MTARRVVLAASIVAFATRALLALARSGPVLMADEAGYLGNARTLAGGAEIVMGSSPFYRSGYSMLLVPVLRMELDPELAYRLVLVVNAALAASLVPLLYLLLTRCCGVAARLSAGAAIAGAAYPSVTTLSQVALSENALFPLTVGWLLAVGVTADARHHAPVHAAVAGACAAGLWLVHGRMVVVPALTALLLVAMAWRRRIGAWAAAAGVGALAAGYVIGRAVDGYIIERSYDGRRTDQVARALRSLDELEGWASALRNLVGQSWYLIVATFGLVVVVAVVALPPALRSLRDGATHAGAAVVISLLGATIGVLVLSATWFDAATRPDQLVYGRYVEPMVPPVVALGAALLGRRAVTPGSRWAALAAIAGSTSAVAVLRGTVDVPEGANRWNVASLPFVTGRIEPAIVAGAGAVALVALLGLLVVVQRRPAAAWLLVAALFVPTTAFSQARLVWHNERISYRDSWSSPRALVERRADRVSYDTSRANNVAIKVYQWVLPHTRFVLFDGTRGAPPTRLFFSNRSWADERPEVAAHRLWEDPARDQALWQLDAEIASPG